MPARSCPAFSAAASRAFGLYAWLVFVAMALPLIGVVALLPGLTRRRGAARAAGRLALRLVGCLPRVSGLQNLPAGSCIIAANHASYVDGFVLTAALPPRFGFVIKREMTAVPLVHFMLRRIGAEFVERFDTRRGASDARRILALAESQHSLTFFPEGTFHPEPGLRRFHGGAFAAAVRGDVPLVPVVLRGTRRMLPAGRLLPRWTTLEVIVKPPIRHNGGDTAVVELRESCRASIAADLDEPDLFASR